MSVVAGRSGIVVVILTEVRERIGCSNGSGLVPALTFLLSD